MVYKCFDKKTASGASANEYVAEDLADLTEMVLMSSKNKNANYSLCIIDVFTKYA